MYTVMMQVSDVRLALLLKTLSHENFFTHLSTELQSQKLAFYHLLCQDKESLPFRSSLRIRIGYVLSNKGSCCYSKLYSTSLT